MAGDDDDLRAVWITVLVLVPIFGAACWLIHHNNRAIRLEDLHVPLLAAAASDRVQLALRDAEAGSLRCGVCAFANFRRVTNCGLCGEALDARAPTKSYYAPTLLLNNPLNNPIRYTARQARARNRREWTRKIDVEGKIFWFRERKEHRAKVPRLAGYVLRFSEFAADELSLAAVFSRESLPTQEAATDSSPLPRVVCDVFPLEHDEERDQPNEQQRESQPQAQVPQLPSKQEVERQLTLQAASISHTLSGSWESDAAAFALAQDSAQYRQGLLTSLEMATTDFPTKFANFVVSSTAFLVPAEREVITINIRREHLLADSVEALSVIPREHIRSPFRVTFADEPGIDAGGIYREWCALFSRSLVGADEAVSSTTSEAAAEAVGGTNGETGVSSGSGNAHPAADNHRAGVFRCVNSSEQTYYLNTNSAHDIGSDHLLYTYAAGRHIGRALLDGHTPGFHLAFPLLKIILGQPVSFNDLEYFDEQAYTSMLWILSNENVEALDLTFTITERRGEGIVEVELVENGGEVRVTDENKELYLQRRFYYLLFESVLGQLYVLLKGVYEVMPQELLALFDPEELDYVLCGSDEIDVDDWRTQTRYSGDLKATHQVTEWFWEILGEMSNESRRRLLHFATGSSRAPIAGFRALTSIDGRLFRFTLKGIPLSESEYVASHACFNQLDLPLYTSRDKLKEALYAILETDVLGGGFTTD